jgi:hypothetical protein
MINNEREGLALVPLPVTKRQTPVVCYRASADFELLTASEHGTKEAGRVNLVFFAASRWRIDGTITSGCDRTKSSASTDHRMISASAQRVTASLLIPSRTAHSRAPHQSARQAPSCLAAWRQFSAVQIGIVVVWPARSEIAHYSSAKPQMRPRAPARGLRLFVQRR